MADRFDWIESKALPEQLKAAVSHLPRFDHLEIGQLPPRPEPSRDAPSDRTPCAHCGQLNEAERQICWACFKYVRAPSPASLPKNEELTIVIDGKTYRAGDPSTPHDIKMLMDRIQKEGYSTELLAQWRSWRATRNVEFGKGDARRSDSDVNVFRGQRVTVIRIDGRMFKSDDPNLSPELKQVFQYIDQHGVTQSLMDCLRRYGDKVKFRPADTPDPSDGELDFWRQVNDKMSAQAQAALALGQAALEARAGFWRWLDWNSRRWLLVGVVLYLLWLLLSATRADRIG
ncbi:MAG: hypothetical protein HY549_03695 [Elusimicrobia bacterium]|nr:hypothetical protein [Elusimicrobiota bacterium]